MPKSSHVARLDGKRLYGLLAVKPFVIDLRDSLESTNEWNPLWWREPSHRNLVFGWTYVDPDHEAADALRLRGSGWWTHSRYGTCRAMRLLGRHHLGSGAGTGPAALDAGRPVCQPPSPAQAAGRSTIPSGTSPVVARRQRAISSFRASATIIVVLRAPLMPEVRSMYHWASALFL